MRALIILSVAAAVFSTTVSYADEIRVGGGGAAIAAIFAPIKSSYTRSSGDQLSIIQSSPSKGLASLIRGEVDIATGAHPIENIVSGAIKEGVSVDPASLTVHAAGRSRTMVVLHRSNPVPRLSRNEIKGIFTGKIVNWKELGGTPGEIIVVWGRITPGQNALFIKEMLDGEPVLADVLEAGDYRSILETVANTPGSIGIDPFAIADSSVHLPEIPLITSPLLVITRGKPAPRVQRLINYITGEGSRLIRQ